jgi:hypothetical protein
VAARINTTPEEASLIGRKAIHARWSREDPTANAVRGQAGLYARFVREAFEADPGITDAEAARRAEHAYQSHMAGLALRSVKARKGRKGRKAGGGDAAS